MAIQLYQKCLNIAVKIENKVYISFAYKALGYEYRGIGDKNKAIENYFKSLEIEKELNK
jgi:tetratricopeptide (TPR) repeat protein